MTDDDDDIGKDKEAEEIEQGILTFTTRTNLDLKFNNSKLLNIEKTCTCNDVFVKFKAVQCHDNKSVNDKLPQW